jgi:hypothetical protein
MQRSNLIDSQIHRSNPAPVRALLFGATYGLSAFSEGRIGRMTALSDKGKMRAGQLASSQTVRMHPAPVRALLFGATYGIASYTAGLLVRLNGIEEVAMRRRAVVLTSFPGRIPS